MRRSAATLRGYAVVSRLLHPVAGALRLKSAAEWLFWCWTRWREGGLHHDHYAHFFTTYFGLTEDFYRGRHLLDVGCGPRGSLEWAHGAGRRVGLDPLARAYRPLGTRRHRMAYVAAPAERMPFADGSFDVVSAFNALDHVDNLPKAAAEMQRVLRAGGTLLLIADVHPAPTLSEPAAFGWDVLKRHFSDCHLVRERHYEGEQLYRSIRAGLPYNHADPRPRYGVLTARLQKRS